MALMTGNEYVESLRKLNMEVYIFGERVECPVDHPIIRPSLNSVKMTYDLAQEPEYEELMTVTSHLTGKKINRFAHIHQSTEDLVKKVKMQRLLGQKTASCFQRCVGMDAFNACYSTTYDMDKKLGTNYHEKLKKYIIYCQENDLTVDGAMTDTKGDRGLAPSAQADPDMFLHIVERREDGIVVRGAKAHQTGIVGGHEALVVFDNVFVPNDRIFMCGEYEFSNSLVERFAGFHRQSYGGCKVGVGDVLIGATALISDYNGTKKASHIKDKIIEMTHLNETLYCAGIACSSEGHKTAAGSYEIDLLLANVCKQNVTRFPYEIARLAEDIAGGILVTLPSEADLNSKEVGHYVEKYLKGVATVPTITRMKVLRFIENLTLGTAAVGYRTESLHGAGSPQAQRIMISRQSNLEAKKQLVKDILDIDI